jgi:hypothetical protein
MINYGAKPQANQVEVILFGPGYGEAIAVHLGDEHWMLVDSCLHPDSKQPAALHYLQAIGVNPNAVRTIVASHWHDDHVRGISALAQACSNAEFVLSDIFSDGETLAFVTAYGGNTAPAQTRGTKELYNAVNVKKGALFAAGHRATVFENAIQGRNVRVTAFSPTTAAKAAWLAHIAQYVPTNPDTPIQHAPDLKPNIESVVLHIDFADDAVLLGSDLENDPKGLGWKSVVSDPWSSTRRKASAYKVAHHGSKSSDMTGIWSTLLVQKPLSSLTPFSPSNLPTPNDKARIKSLASAVYISSSASKRPVIERSQLKRMETMSKNIVRLNAGFGAVRFRKFLGASNWSKELFGQAKQL